ncbi:Phage protein [Sinorhizobium sojae CCBAU 05684]|uniref:Phage protein n=1 Tax=Sinorhizobium sojae CCBAU 05684 TaxID=716928 RepID=A0A249PB09_9HYPH|nr:hypothetical protein [Sinorhizobium sojae]ASY62469.1 Phage protein [Sinorhizobium sojae CCBAU 05684]
MVQRISKGDRVKISGKVSRVWPNGLVSLYPDGLDYPITVRPEDIDEVLPKERPPKEKPVGGRRKPIYDEQD